MKSEVPFIYLFLEHNFGMVIFVINRKYIRTVYYFYMKQFINTGLEISLKCIKNYHNMFRIPTASCKCNYKIIYFLFW